MSKLSEHPGAAALAIVGTAGCVTSWTASLIGPRSFLFFGVLGFLCGWIGLATAGRKNQRVEAGEIDRLGRVLRRVARATGLVVLVSLLGMFAMARSGGVADAPAFEKRPVYELQNHGHRTPVSRLRYILVSASFFTGWHGMALLANLGALGRRLYGTDLL